MSCLFRAFGECLSNLCVHRWVFCVPWKLSSIISDMEQSVPVLLRLLWRTLPLVGRQKHNARVEVTLQTIKNRIGIAYPQVTKHLVGSAGMNKFIGGYDLRRCLAISKARR